MSALSECCGASPNSNYYHDEEDGICSDCGEHSSFPSHCQMCGSEDVYEGKGDDALCLPCCID